MKYAFVQWIFVIAIILSSCNGFNVRSRLFMSTVAPNSLKTIPKGKIWPGNRPPVPNLQLLEQRMDATWGRGKFRTEVWEDDVNPVNFWWDAYAPSEETLEAIELGFDFMDPKGWLEERGINYESAIAETKRISEERYQAYKQEKEEAIRKVKEGGMDKFRKEFFDMQKLAFEVAFRAIDDENQRKKGEPSLENEDTGVQWKNDPV